MKILVVEDEVTLSAEMLKYLTSQSYTCHAAQSIKEATQLLLDRCYDFVLLDLGLPDGDGFEVLKGLKENHSQTMVIILSARGDITDRIEGLEMGADDYLPKPFSLAELHARIQAMIRRRFGLVRSAVQVGDFEVDLDRRVVLYKDTEIHLYKKEFDILSYLLLHKNRPLSRTQLYEHVWGDLVFAVGDSNYIDVHIKNIRKKLSALSTVEWLESVRGIGYKINLPE